MRDSNYSKSLSPETLLYGYFTKCKVSCSIKKNQFMFLARQVYPENCISLYNAYLNATKRPYG